MPKNQYNTRNKYVCHVYLREGEGTEYHVGHRSFRTITKAKAWLDYQHPKGLARMFKIPLGKESMFFSVNLYSMEDNTYKFISGANCTLLRRSNLRVVKPAIAHGELAPKPTE